MTRLIFAVLLAGCNWDSGVVKTCVNYLEDDAYCGTSFYIGDGTMITSTHVIEQSNDNVVTIVKPGFNDLADGFDHIGNDVTKLFYKPEGDVEGARICDVSEFKVGDAVEIIGVIDWRGAEVEVKDGTIYQISNGRIYIDGELEQGYSGGPVKHIDNDCVCGMIHGLSINAIGEIYVTAENLSEMRRDGRI